MIRPIEQIEKAGEPLFHNRTTANNMRSWIQGQINKFAKANNAEYEFFFNEVLNAYNHFHPIQNSQVEVDSWKGKSSIELIKGIDRLTIIKFQRKDQFSKPIEIRTEVTKGELISLIDAINFLQERLKDREFITTKEIAFQYCLNLDIKETDRGRPLFKGDFWDTFFSWRPAHTKLVLMLDALIELNQIDYRAGQIKLLKNKIGIQMIL